MPLPPFRDLKDPDEKRREIVWIAISFIVILATWLSVVLLFGYQPLIMGMTYDEFVLLLGLGLLLFCSVLYLGAREREQRSANKSLVTKLRGAVESLDERVEQLNGLCTASAELAGALDIEQISHSVVEAAVNAVGAEASYLALVEGESLRPVYLRCSQPEGAPDGTLDIDAIRAHFRPPRSEDADWELEPWDEWHREMRAPLRLSNDLMGVLGARRGEKDGVFSSDDLRLLTTLANMAAKAIESAQLHAELKESYLATVRSLVNSLHARDNYTASHGERVAALAVRMAEYLGLADSMVRDIEVFGPLHDVGKIGIRDKILLKPDPLSEDERTACREHCEIGERILRPLRPGREALAMVRNHHESWDGRGYPDGLAEERIPLLARLLSVADSYDAMRTDRPYQPAMSDQEVLAHFRQYSGKLYDPVSVGALCAVVRGDDAEAPRETAQGQLSAAAARHKNSMVPNAGGAR